MCLGSQQVSDSGKWEIGGEGQARAYGQSGCLAMCVIICSFVCVCVLFIYLGTEFTMVCKIPQNPAFMELHWGRR